ncbi:MAG: hypothetical protein A2005_01190 [Desulfuromonadales bacterium GWC2_61_20]|nr:MAG: hypothetical protein A2005_01190 [Desulfuromonadales bacterium GWC2_61_20]
MNILLCCIVVFLCVSPNSIAAETLTLKDENDKISYSVGYQVGGDFKNQGVKLNAEAVVQGIRDAGGQRKPLLSPEDMRTTLIELKQKIVAGQAPLNPEAANPVSAGQQLEQARAARDFLDQNAKKDGVTVLPDGVQYRILKAGSGRRPTLDDEVAINFRTTLIDGKEIATTYRDEVGTPKVYRVAKILPGLQGVLPLMAEGSKWQVVLPPLVGGRERELLQSHKVLIYDIELVSVMTAAKAQP